MPSIIDLVKMNVDSNLRASSFTTMLALMRASHYLILFLIAREIFTVPASKILILHSFSGGGYMLDKGQSIMIPKNLEAQVLLKDHTLVEDREQENKL